MSVPALTGPQAMITVDFDFRADPALCGGGGDPLVLVFNRVDSGTSELVVQNVHVIFE